MSDEEIPDIGNQPQITRRTQMKMMEDGERKVRRARWFVRMFKPRFAALVESGVKCQTIRPKPKRMPMAGDRISLRAWIGKPYRSKQKILCQAVITDVQPCFISRSGIIVGEKWTEFFDMNSIAVADGFRDAHEMRSWFEETHGLPFNGILIKFQRLENELAIRRSNARLHAQ